MIQFVIAAVVAAIAALIVKQIKPEFAVFIQLGGVAVVALLLMSTLRELIAAVEGILDYAPLAGGTGGIAGLGGNNAFTMLVRALGICITTQIAADVCRDSGFAALTNVVELGGRLLILALTLPLLQSIAQLAVGMIRG